MIHTGSLIEAVQRGHVLKDFPPNYLDRLAALASEVSFETGQIIFHEGDRVGLFYILESGRIGLEMIATGRPMLVQTLQEGDAMGWSSLLETGFKHFQARALTPVKALALDGAVVRHACEEDPAFGYAIMKSLLTLVTERLDVTRMQLLDMYGKPGAVGL